MMIFALHIASVMFCFRMPEKKPQRNSISTSTAIKVNAGELFLLIAFLVSLFVIQPEGETHLTPQRVEGLKGNSAHGSNAVARAN